MYANDKMADQAVHWISLFSDFVIQSLESSIPQLAMCTISMF